MNNRARSIVLTDWASNVDLIHGNYIGFIQRLQILSLLYDEILIQDEFLALSSPLGKWFSTNEGKNTWSELMDLGTIVVLRHPATAYARADHRELSRDAPILARARQIEATATKDASAFRSTPEQDAFYSHVDACLRLRPSQSREVGSIRKLEIMPAFVQTLESLLAPKNDFARQQNQGWLSAHFAGLNSRALERFLSYAKNPEEVIADRHQVGMTTNAVFTSDGPVFNRSLAMQAGQLFTLEEAELLGNLVQSAFVAPFCWRENALGQYGGRIIPIPEPEVEFSSASDLGLVSIQAEVAVPIRVPGVGPGFSTVIAKVRETEVGLRLRDSIARLPQTPDFRLQHESWHAVASLLAANVNHEADLAISIHQAVDCATHALQVGVLIHFFGAAFSGQDIGLDAVLHTVPEVAKHATAGLAIEQLRRVTARVVNDHTRSSNEYQLEKAVEFGCVWLREPSQFGDRDPEA